MITQPYGTLGFVDPRKIPEGFHWRRYIGLLRFAVESESDVL